MRIESADLAGLVSRTWMWAARLVLAVTALSALIPAAHAGEDLEQRVQSSYGPAAAARARQLTVILDGLRQAPVSEQLRQVNRYFNAFIYSTDKVLWGRDDHWASPEEFVGLGAGDCEDFAIGKYFALRSLGIPAESMQVSYVHDIQRRQFHIVLEVQIADGSERMLLDNAQPLVMSASQRRDLVKVVGFGERHVAVALPEGGERSFLRAGRWSMRQWDQVLARSQLGFEGNSDRARSPKFQRASWRIY
jgi:predicted transglutaminase-like cysteine proteinase